MANSDNVIRLGLTPKFVDKENFEIIITNKFEDLLNDEYKFEGKRKNDFQTEYLKENVKDFKLNFFKLEKNKKVEYHNENLSILFIVKGNLNVQILENSQNIEEKIFSIDYYTPYLLEKNLSVEFLMNSELSNEEFVEFYIASY